MNLQMGSMGLDGPQVLAALGYSSLAIWGFPKVGVPHYWDPSCKGRLLFEGLCF